MFIKSSPFVGFPTYFLYCITAASLLARKICVKNHAAFLQFVFCRACEYNIIWAIKNHEILPLLVSPPARQFAQKILRIFRANILRNSSQNKNRAAHRLLMSGAILLLYHPCAIFSSFRKARCSTLEKLTLRLTAISFSHLGMVRDFRTAFSKCVRAYSSTSTETMLIKRSSSP